MTEQPKPRPLTEPLAFATTFAQFTQLWQEARLLDLMRLRVENKQLRARLDYWTSQKAATLVAFLVRAWCAAAADTNTAYFSRPDMTVNGKKEVAYPFRKDQKPQYSKDGKLMPPLPANARTNDLHLHSSRESNAVKK